MSQYNAKHKLKKLYDKYLSGNISREEYDELFDLIRDESNEHIVKAVIDGTLPEHILLKNEATPQIHETRKSLNQETGISRRVILFRIAAAAAILILIVSALLLWNDTEEQWVVYTTSYQETKEVTLPDGSSVFMNANSELKWQQGIEVAAKRLVYFKGEGYFDVAHREGKSFTVNTGQVNVNVLGTEFNLETRREYTNVFLKEGKVVLEAQDFQTVEMEPGDLVHFDQEKKKIKKLENQEPGTALSWKDGVFTFEDLTGIQILEKMEDIYGKEFIIKEPERLSDVIVVQGLPYTDWDFVQQALELSLDVKFKDSTANRIIVKTK